MFEKDLFFDLTSFSHKNIFKHIKNIWEAVTLIKSNVFLNIIPEIKGHINNNAIIEGDIYIGEGSIIEANAIVKGPCYIGNNCIIRSNSYLRKNIIIGNNCVIGHGVEIKNTMLLDNVQVAHLSYVGDSIIGNNSHLGAGVILSNLKLSKKEISIIFDEKIISTGLIKLGSIIGDNVEIGCNTVLNPGTIIGKNSVIYPMLCIKGVINSETIIKNSNL